jgi:hypothetical protein
MCFNLNGQTLLSCFPPAVFFQSSDKQHDIAGQKEVCDSVKPTERVFDMGQKPIGLAPQSSATCLICIALLLSLSLQVQNPFFLLARAARSPASFPESQVVAEPSWPI